MKTLLRNLYFLAFGLVLVPLSAQNPHGQNFKMDCNQCHNPNGWIVVASEMKFEHASSGFELEGRHEVISCKDCHQTLQFNEAESNCISCHTDVHQASVGNDCKRCHNAQNWLVNNIPELHEANGFPLAGAHNTLSCVDCHDAGNTLQWVNQGNDCISCHQQDFVSAQEPNHVAGGFSQNCVECHEPISQEWVGNTSHFFFPLTQGHDINDCFACHTSPQFNQQNSECVSCHLTDFDNATDPNHTASGFGTDCIQCHTTAPGWRPAGFPDHDANFFPIYSGEHNGVWASCTECHTNAGNFSTFSCIDCHEHNNSTEMADEHDDVNGYIFESNACFSCHPTGSEDG